MVCGTYSMADTSQLEEFCIEFIYKLSSLVGVAYLEAPESAYEAQKKLGDRMCTLVWKWLGLYPLRKIIGTSYNILVTISAHL